MSSLISFARSSASRNSRSAWNQNSSSLPTGRLFSIQISPGALSDFFFVGFCQSAGSLFQLRCQGQYTLNRFPIAYPPRELAVLVGLLEKAGDRLLLIHRTLSIKLDDGALNLFNGLEGLKLILAPGTRGHICELFAESPHWRERLTELSRLYADALDVAMERSGDTDD